MGWVGKGRWLRLRYNTHVGRNSNTFKVLICLNWLWSSSILLNISTKSSWSQLVLDRLHGIFLTKKIIEFGPSNPLVSPNLADFFFRVFWDEKVTLPGTITYPTKREQENHRSSKVPLKRCSQEGIPKKPIEKRPPWRGPLATRFVYNSERWSRWESGGGNQNSGTVPGTAKDHCWYKPFSENWTGLFFFNIWWISDLGSCWCPLYIRDNQQYVSWRSGINLHFSVWDAGSPGLTCNS